ncbi:ribosome biogenesis GTPase YlqF [Mycoplasma sp. Ms02]|uniref:ribosome biogenesis GTPase YlqF n=1 Tax=Mycoplasma sp. Ms02 TaxID=353851 RepID=UPI001C89C826|nr:ribosome biogenesis GTPase YlqF [Mycoplasma sp. Ms02]QZE12269.1 ribosome biogenesis GTPase YlqF [Mycoplasma sp. Ms02]
MDIKIKEEYDILINWYPGHMAKAMKEIKENSPLLDLFIVVLDARSPISSYNEDFDSISPTKPRLFVITKSDLMDKSKVDMIKERFKGSKIIWADLRKKNSRQIILKAIKQLTKEKVEREKQKGFVNPKIKCFVVGVPNAGKSSLINLMSQNSKLEVANYPGVTRSKKWVAVDNYYFMDTPGILLPKLTDQFAGVKLAAISSIKIDVFPKMFLATEFYKLISNYYPNKIQDLGVEPELEDAAVYNQLRSLAKQRNFIANGGSVDIDKVYDWFINWVKYLKDVTYE